MFAIFPTLAFTIFRRDLSDAYTRKVRNRVFKTTEELSTNQGLSIICVSNSVNAREHRAMKIILRQITTKRRIWMADTSLFTMISN